MPELSATATRPVVIERLLRLSPAAAAFLAGAAPVVLLGFSRGGYPVEVVAGYGVALWWLLLVGFLTDAIPRPRPTRLGWAALASVACLSVWGGLSLTVSASPERGLTEVVRLIVAGGSLLLGMSAVRAGQARVLAGGVLAGLTAIVAAAVLTRLFPDLVSDATATGDFLPEYRRRLSWPLNYWNAVAASAALAVPLAVVLASRSRTAWTSALAAAPVPVLALGIAYTLSRAGMAVTACAVLSAVAAVSPRPLLLRTIVVAVFGAAVVVFAGLRPDALTDVAGGTAQTNAGRRVFVVALIATVGVAFLQGGLRTADRAHWTPRLPRPRGRWAAAVAGTALAVVLVAAVAADVSGRASTAWDEFREGTNATSTVNTDTSARLSSFNGTGRYQLWSGAVDGFEEAPLRGIGLGSWESWWNPNRGDVGYVRNAHSQVFELLAETGIVGAALFLLMIGTPITAGVAAAVRRRGRSQPDGLLVVPALMAFAIALSVDWNWQIGAFMVAGMTLAAVPLATNGEASGRALTGARGATAKARRRAYGRRVAMGVGLTLVAVASIATLAVALVAPQSVAASREALARGDVASAASEAARGESAVGFAASPALQRALVEEQSGDLAAAEAAARRAAARTPEDWRPWFVVARIAAARGRDDVAIAAFRRARTLNPRSALLQP